MQSSKFAADVSDSGILAGSDAIAALAGVPFRERLYAVAESCILSIH